MAELVERIFERMYKTFLQSWKLVLASRDIKVDEVFGMEGNIVVIIRKSCVVSRFYIVAFAADEAEAIHVSNNAPDCVWIVFFQLNLRRICFFEILLQRGSEVLRSSAGYDSVSFDCVAVPEADRDVGVLFGVEVPAKCQPGNVAVQTECAYCEKSPSVPASDMMKAGLNGDAKWVEVKERSKNRSSCGDLRLMEGAGK